MGVSLTHYKFNHPAMEWVAPTTEKAAPASPADVFTAGNERAIMKLPASYATEVFINSAGGLSILQDPGDHEDDVIVALNREQARLVAAEIMRLDGDDSAWVVEKEV